MYNNNDNNNNRLYAQTLFHFIILYMPSFLLKLMMFVYSEICTDQYNNILHLQ